MRPSDAELFEYKKQVYDRFGAIDPEVEIDRFSLTVGWFLARGVEPKKARAYATYIRYETDLA